LGVRYVLEGSARKAGNRVRVTGSVVGTIAPQLERAEIQCAKHKPTEKHDAYDYYYLRGMASFHRGNQEGMTEALPPFYQAIERDPDFASAYALAAACLFWTNSAAGSLIAPD
jgi:hypothetical protein